MATWTPLEFFGVAIVLAALAALGTLMAPGRDITPRSILETVLKHGIFGGAMGFAAYDWFNLKEMPGVALLIAITWGALIRVPAIHFEAADVKKILRRIIRSFFSETADE